MADEMKRFEEQFAAILQILKDGYKDEPTLQNGLRTDADEIFVKVHKGEISYTDGIEQLRNLCTKCSAKIPIGEKGSVLQGQTTIEESIAAASKTADAQQTLDQPTQQITTPPSTEPAKAEPFQTEPSIPFFESDSSIKALPVTLTKGIKHETSKKEKVRDARTSKELKVFEGRVTPESPTFQTTNIYERKEIRPPIHPLAFGVGAELKRDIKGFILPQKKKKQEKKYFTIPFRVSSTAVMNAQKSAGKKK